MAPICWFIVGEVARIDERKLPKLLLKSSTYLGRVSYGIYCWHALLGWISFPEFLLKRLGLALHGFERSLFDIGITLFLVLATTELSIRFFELPIRNFAAKRLNRSVLMK